MSRQGRNLERLVALLEEALGPQGVKVASPEYFVGELSGAVREVDITLRAKIGSSDVLVMIECRDRTNRQGVRWIQEVAIKREDIGADLAMVVSQSGFSKGAIRMAEAKGIQLRTIENLDLEEFKTILSSKVVGVAIKHCELEKLTIKCKKSGQKRTKVNVEPQLLTEKVFSFNADSPSLRLEDILQVGNAENPEEFNRIEDILFDDLDSHLHDPPPPGTSRIVLAKEASYELAVVGSLKLHLPGRIVEIVGFTIRVRSWVQLGSFVIDGWKAYRPMKADAIAHAAEGIVNLGIPQQVLMIFTDSPQGVSRSCTIHVGDSLSKSPLRKRGSPD